MLSALFFVDSYIEIVMAILVYNFLSDGDVHDISLFANLLRMMRIFFLKFNYTDTVNLAALATADRKYQDTACRFIECRQTSSSRRKSGPKSIGGIRLGTYAHRIARRGVRNNEHAGPDMVQAPTGGYNCTVM